MAINFNMRVGQAEMYEEMMAEHEMDAGVPIGSSYNSSRGHPDVESVFEFLRQLQGMSLGRNARAAAAVAKFEKLMLKDVTPEYRQQLAPMIERLVASAGDPTKCEQAFEALTSEWERKAHEMASKR